MGLLASSQFLTSLFLVGLALTVAGLLMRTARQLSRRTSGAEPIVDSRRVVAPNGPKVGPPAELVQWEVRMHETARELTGELASRISALRALVSEADRAAARLEAALDGAGPLAARPAVPCEWRSQTTGLCASAFGGNGDLPAAEGHRQIPPPAEEPPDGRPLAQQPLAGHRGSSPAPRCSQQRREEICLLADYGFEPAEIARRTSIPLGEVELILSLRPPE